MSNMDDLDALCAEAEAMWAVLGREIGEDEPPPTDLEIQNMPLDEWHELSYQLLPRLLAERKAWREGRPMYDPELERYKRPDEVILIQSDTSHRSFAAWNDEPGFEGWITGLEAPAKVTRWWPLPGKPQ